ncbi:hypothetical protein TruAng_002890 [Truncatella angustata]|nr:hypothetical protein TruAng_002890 [Truncatella angustata]
MPSHGSTLIIPIALLSLVLGYLVINAIYAVTLHPLADVPGPRVCAASRAVYWYRFMNGRDVRWLYRLHQRYGPVVRFGPSDVSYAAPQAWRDIYGVGKGRPDMLKPGDANMRPANGMSVFVSKAEGCRVFAVDSLVLRRCPKRVDCGYRESCAHEKDVFAGIFGEGVEEAAGAV